MTERVLGVDVVDEWQPKFAGEVFPHAPTARYALFRYVRSADSAYATRSRHACFSTLADAQAAIGEALAREPEAARQWISFQAASRYQY